jgi:nicotinamide-nucleotide amidase
VLPNPRGTAPGIWWETPGGLVVMLPGVPREMRGLMREEVLPRLTKRGAGTTVTRSRTIRTAGIPESNLAARIGPIEESLAPLTLAYLPDVTGVDLRLTAWELPEAEAEERLERAAADLEHRIVPHAYGRDETDLAARLLEGLRRHRWRLAVAESCTGGLLAGRITAVPGCSDAFVGGLVLYDDAAKRELAGVPSLLLESAGAVSEGVVRELVEAAARNFRAEAAVGITGIAGPTGGSDEKPVGTVWFGFKLGDRIWTEHVVFPGNRAEIRARSAQHALYALWRHLPD